MTREFRVSRAPFGTLSGGEAVERITLSASSGMEVGILTWGASLQSVLVPDRDGVLADVTLGHATLRDYLDQPQYMGATVGRVANRIAAGRFPFDGGAVQVPVNNGPNALHGGPGGFDQRNWSVLAVEEIDRASVTLGHVSPDGDQGFPGTLTVTATYALHGDNSLSVAYRAATDRPTVVNISNHAYWNLAGEGSSNGAMEQLLTIHGDHYLPVDDTLIPTGEVGPVEGTVFDFRDPRAIGERVRNASDEQLRFGRGYDHDWVVGPGVCEEPRPIARVEDPHSGRVMEIHSNQPGLQFYSGNFFDGSGVGKSGRLYRMGDAIALEPQQHPDTVNRPDFGSLRLEPGETYRNIIVWRFSTS